MVGVSGARLCVTGRLIWGACRVRITVMRYIAQDGARPPQLGEYSGGCGSVRAVPVRRIVSGGQTGVDRAALDFALRYGIDYTGYVPRGRRAEDEPIPRRYDGLVELETRSYRARTIRNVRASDGVLLLFAARTPGVRLTEGSALRLGRPLYRIDLRHPLRVESERERLRRWLKDNRIDVLHVAGNAESSAPGIYGRALALLERLLL